MSRRRIRPCIIGRDGAGKSWFAATFPKKMLVCLFDPPDKASEYLARGVPGEIEQGKHCYFQNVFSANDPAKLIIRVEYWGESNPESPTSYGRFIQRSATLEKEIAEEGYQTVVLDSVTAFELAARFYSENFINKGVKDGRQHYGFSRHAAEQYIMTRWPNLIFTNAVVIAHYQDGKDEGDNELTVPMKEIALPGTLPQLLGSAFSEVWRVYRDDQGGRHVQMRERPGSHFKCKTTVGFQDGVYPHYEALWKSVEGGETDAVPASGGHPVAESAALPTVQGDGEKGEGDVPDK